MLPITVLTLKRFDLSFGVFSVHQEMKFISHRLKLAETASTPENKAFFCVSNSIRGLLALPPLLLNGCFDYTILKWINSVLRNNPY